MIENIRKGFASIAEPPACEQFISKMPLPSFNNGWINNKRMKPRIQVLEIRDRGQADGEPLAWLLVEREEIYRHDPTDNSIYEASICLHYEQILPKHDWRRGGINHGSFYGGYLKYTNQVSLTSSSLGSSGGVFLDPPELTGQRIGTYLFNEIVTWAQRWPEASVNSVTLLAGQAGEDNKARRNRFYEQFGLVFEYADPEHREGKSLPMLVKALTPVETWKANIKERQALDYIADILYAEKNASFELIHRERAIKELLDDRKKAEAKPIRWALRILWWRYARLVPIGIIITGLVALIWARFRL
jgi:GNAT superfamily N-acetyltransferase